MREDLALRMQNVSIETLQAQIAKLPPALPAAQLLSNRSFSVIAEVKRASPSKGHLAQISDPAQLALDYQNGGAQSYQRANRRAQVGGTLADLDAVRSKVSIPVLRKDFMVEDYQVWEARAHGADLIY